MAELSAWVVNTTAQSFEADVVQRSMDVPVVIDFWAPWCGPCRELTPLLEKLVQESAGRFVLAKINIDENPELAQAFRVQSIPFVVAIRDAQPVNHFLGVLSEPELRDWLATVLPSPIEELLKRAEAVEAHDPAQAETFYRQAAELDPKNDAIRIRWAGALLALHRDDEARHIITELEARGFLEPEAERIKSQLDLRAAAAEAGGLAEARAAAEANPDDLEVQLKLADALAVAGRYEEALNLCLSLIERDKAGIGPQAKETMVKIFDTLGPTSQLASTYRRRLATAFY